MLQQREKGQGERERIGPTGGHHCWLNCLCNRCRLNSWYLGSLEKVSPPTSTMCPHLDSTVQIVREDLSIKMILKHTYSYYERYKTLTGLPLGLSGWDVLTIQLVD